MVETEDMRLKVFVLFQMLAAASCAFADETLPVLKTGNTVYSNVTVISVSATDVYFTYGQGKGIGVANAKLKTLDPALQKHFNYNAANAAAAANRQAQANTDYRNQLINQPARRAADTAQEAPAAISSSKALWREDLPGALSQARSENKMVLLDFTGSDWCPWCIKFDQEVLSTSQFAAYAGKNLELVKVDFPRHTPLPADQQRANDALAKQFNVDGYPTYVLLDSAGRELGRQVGYQEGGPSAFIAELDGFSKR